jgi:hypothetical protein
MVSTRVKLIYLVSVQTSAVSFQSRRIATTLSLDEKAYKTKKCNKMRLGCSRPFHMSGNIKGNLGAMYHCTATRVPESVPSSLDSRQHSFVSISCLEVAETGAWNFV